MTSPHLAISIICAGVLLAVVLAKRMRDSREMERHTITPEALQALLATKQDVLVFDVRQPLDLLGDSVIIPGAQWIAPDTVRANPSLLPKERDLVVYCTCPSDKTSRIILHRTLAMGFIRIKFLKEGLDGWKANGFPVEPYKKPFHLNSDKRITLRPRASGSGRGRAEARGSDKGPTMIPRVSQSAKRSHPRGLWNGASTVRAKAVINLLTDGLCK